MEKEPENKAELGTTEVFNKNQSNVNPRPEIGQKRGREQA